MRNASYLLETSILTILCQKCVNGSKMSRKYMSITGYYWKIMLDTESYDYIGDSPIYLLL